MGNEARSFNPEESEELKLQESAEEETPKQIKTKLGAPSSKTGDVVQAGVADLGPREKLFKATEKSKKAEQYRDYVGKSFEKSYGEEGKKDRPIFQMAEELVEREAHKKAAAIKELKAKILKEMRESDANMAKNKQDPNARFQKIRVTPELKEARKRAAQKDLEEANAKLVDAEDALIEAKKQRPGALARFFSGLKIGKPSAAEIAYRQAWQDADTPPEELDKLETAVINTSTSQTLASEIVYQRAWKAVAEAKKRVEETKNTAQNLENNDGQKQEATDTRSKRITIGGATPGGYVALRARAQIIEKTPPIEEKKPEKPIAKKPTIQAGEHKIIFKPEPAKPKRKVEVNLPPALEEEQEISPEAVINAKQQLENSIKSMFFKQDGSEQLILANAALMERLADANFQGEQQILNKAIMDTKEEMLNPYKLKLEEQLKLEGAKFNDLSEGGKLAGRLKIVFKKQPENYRHFLALTDLYEANATAAGRPVVKKIARPAPPVFRNW
ncbi:MAG: hypothetical protein AAB849_00325 [Patescibacteria group bacterium]